MPSPFPGMDPYLEASSRWLDFHNNLATEIQAALNRVLDPRYIATLTSYVVHEIVAITPRPRRSRQSVVEDWAEPRHASEAPSDAAS